MKTNRNEPCLCGSGKKHKNCCGSKRFQTSAGNRYIRWIISGIVSLFLILTVWSIVEYFTTEHPEMEAYKCDNPQCNRIHYRAVSQSN